MLLRQIKYFVTVVDTGSFTEAAEECFISQSAISQQILSLEKELGVQLLVRSTRRSSCRYGAASILKKCTSAKACPLTTA